MQHSLKLGVKTGSKGEKCWNSKVTEDQVIAIRNLSLTMKQKDIAELFGINFRQVSDIITRKSWKWL